MKPIRHIGVALVVAAALGIVACNNESVSAPDFNGSNSSAVEKPNPESSSTDVKNLPALSSALAQSSSSVAISSSGKVETCKHVTDVVCEPCPLGEKCSCHPCDSNKEFKSYDCSSGVELHCENGEWLTPKQFCPNGRWTTSCNGLMLHDPVCCTEKETCVEVSGKVCAPCKEGYKCPCNPCDSTKDKSAIDCGTGKPLVCKDGEWSFNYENNSSSSASVKSSSSSVAEKCRDFKNMCPPCDPVVGCNLTNVPCNQCDSKYDNAARDCETGMTYICTNRLWAPLEDPYETCRHITDFGGAGSVCRNENGSSAVDCLTGGNYKCQNNRWQSVSCLNIKPDECKPGMGGCGYRLCEPNGIQEIADCENSVTYVCNGESWEVKKTEENQRCARGELEYCNACFEEGKFEGRYKCEGGKWREYGLGDEICEHNTDLNCKIGEDECCVPASVRCSSNSIIGTTCENGTVKVIDGCAYTCNGGVYMYAPPPM